MKREGNKKEIIAALTSEICAKLRSYSDGEEATIAKMVSNIYISRGYEFISSEIGYVWSKDHGKTYAIKDMEQFDILNKATTALKKEINLDSSTYEDVPVGLPYNTPFIIRKV